jgi:DNA-binding beta-propeller fold protein YncE
LNQQGTPNFTEFEIAKDGTLTPIAGSYDLPGGVGALPGQISVTRGGKLAIVTEEHTGLIDLFPLTPGGQVASVQSNGPKPFGFAFGPNQTLLMTEQGNSTISSYNVLEGTTPSLQTITDSLPDLGITACWIVTNPARDFAFVANFYSESISSLAVSSTGALSLIASEAGNMGAGNLPADMALTHDGKFLYILSSSTGLVAEYSVNGATLTPVGTVTGLPTSLQGVAAW